MTRKRRRLYVLGLAMLALAAATALVLNALEDSIVFFYGPSDVVAGAEPLPQGPFRLGGLVADGSVRHDFDGEGGAPTVHFAVTDRQHSVPVVFAGALPDLFREGQGVVAEGRLGADGVFVASEVLAKHDENYMPPEVADALERAGLFRPAEASGSGRAGGER